MFKQVTAAVLSFFKIDALPKKDGKSVLTEDMKKKLTEEWGEKFAAKFEKNLSEGGEESDDDPELESTKKQLADMKVKFEKALEDKKDLESKVAKLSKESEKDDAEEIKPAGAGKKAEFKPNMAYAHNKVIDAYFRGDTSITCTTKI